MRPEVDAGIEALMDKLLVRQQAFERQHGRYWQAPRSKVVAPTEATPAEGDQLNVALDPTGIPWLVMVPEIAGPQRAAVLVDQYHATSGRGYLVTVFVRVGGVEHSRQINVGPEKHLSRDWTKRTVVAARAK